MFNVNALIVDDEENSRENIAMLLRDFCPEVKVIGSAGTIDEAEQKITQLKPELVFLDIQIGRQTGFDLLERFARINFEIIFITAFDQHAVRAFEFTAVDYLLKPVDISKLTQAVARAGEKIAVKPESTSLKEMIRHVRNFEREKHKIALSTSKGYEMYYIRDIMYCEAEGSYTRFTFSGGEQLVVSKNLKYYQSLLQPYHFVRCHNSSLVNLQYVKRLERSGTGGLIMENDKQLAISKNKRKEMEQIIKDKKRLI